MTVARAIVPLAFRLKRYAEAVRYALKAVEMDQHADPVLLSRLGTYLIESADYQGAAKLYEKAMAARRDHKETAADIDRRMSLGRLYHLVEEYGKAADCFDRVSYALEHPDESGLDQKQKKELLKEPGPTYNLFGE